MPIAPSTTTNGNWRQMLLRQLWIFKTPGTPRYFLYTGKSNTWQAESNNMVYARIKQIYIDVASIQNEWILIMPNNKAESWQGDHIPPSYGGAARLQPLQEQVDEYEFVGNDGYGYATYDPKAKAKGFDDNLPFNNRDPRFYSDIMYHGCTFQNKVINTATGTDKIGAQKGHINRILPAQIFPRRLEEERKLASSLPNDPSSPKFS